MTEPSLTRQIERCINALLTTRSEAASICPSEVARAVGKARGEDWRELMSVTRGVAVRLARSGRLRITRQGRALDPDDLGAGPIRLRRPILPE